MADRMKFTVFTIRGENSECYFCNRVIREGSKMTIMDGTKEQPKPYEHSGWTCCLVCALSASADVTEENDEPVQV